MTLRNPADRPATFALKVGAAFELPAGAAGSFRVCSPYPVSPTPVPTLRADEAVNLTLRPFEALACLP